MINKGYLKPEISIELIGKRKFWTGIILGFLFSLVLSYFFNYSRESLRFITFNGDPFILSPKEFKKYDLFFASLSASIGFGIAIVYWFLGYNNRIVKRYLKRFAITNALFVSIVVLMVVSRFGSILPIILYRNGFDGQLLIHRDYGLLLILTPLYVFFGNWNAVRAFLRTRHWILISFAIYCLVTLFLYKTTALNKDNLNAHYYHQNRERFEYIDQQLRMAARMDITFTNDIKTILQKRYSPRTNELVISLKNAFESDRQLTIDTLILEKIVIHNMNEQGRWYFRHGEDRDKNWSYALPEDVYDQIQMNEIGSPEMKILFEILGEQVKLFIAEDYNWEYYETYSPYEIELSLYNRNIIYSTNTILSRLVQVVDKIKSEEKYKEYHCIVPDIKFNDHRGRQIWYDLNLD